MNYVLPSKVKTTPKACSFSFSKTLPQTLKLPQMLLYRISTPTYIRLLAWSNLLMLLEKLLVVCP